MRGLCLVTGATGALGPAVVNAFRHAGYHVRALARRVPPAGLFPDDVQVIRGDLLDPSCLSRALDDVEAVVHLAALLHITDPTPSMREEYERINIAGTESLVQACRDSSVRRIVYFSSIAVYGYRNKAVLTESTEPDPDTLYGRTKLDAERIVLAARDGDGEPIGTVLRLAAVYGSRVKGNYLRLVESLRRGTFIPLGRGANHRALIYDKDAAAAAVLAAQHPLALGEIFNVSDGSSPTLAEIVANISEALGRRPPRLYLPATPVRWLVGILHRLAGSMGLRSPVTPATLDKYFEDVRVDSSKIGNQLGFRPQYDQASGWKDALTAIRSGPAVPPTAPRNR